MLARTVERPPVDHQSFVTGAGDIPGPHGNVVDPIVPPPGFVESAIVDLFAAVVARQPDACALVGEHEGLSFAEVAGRVNALAAAIDTSVDARAAVAVLLDNGPTAMIALLAALRAGRPCIVLNAEHPVERNAAIITAAAPGAVILDDAVRSEVALIASPARCLFVSDVTPSDGTPLPALPHDADAPAVILYTSGSTGTPTGFAISQATILERVRSNMLATPLGSADRLMSFVTLGTVAGLVAGVLALLNGVTQFLVSVARIGAREILARVAAEGITVVWSVPSILRALFACADARAALESVRLVRTFGEPVLAVELDAWRRVLAPDALFSISYGQTEMGIAQWLVPAGFNADAPTLPAGHIFPNVDWQIVDESGCAVRPGDAGELVVRTRFVTLGEWRNGACMPERIQTDPANPRRRLHWTGDVVRLRPDGMIHVLRRNDRQVKIRGSRIELAEVEAAIRGLPQIADAAVVSMNVSGDEARLVAYIVCLPEADAGCAARTRIALRGKLPNAMLPDRLVRLDALPRLPGGKVDLRELQARGAPSEERARAIAHAGSGADIDVRGPVARAWRRTLGAHSLQADIAFDAAGGDSLRLLKFVYRLEAELGRTLPLEIFTTTQPPSEFTAALDRYLNEDQQRAPAAPVFLFPGIGGDDPRLADFRASCRDGLDIVLMSYPDWTAMVERRPAFSVLVAQAVADIERLAPHGSLRLAGYSFGGHVAYACGVALAAAGRSIDSLAIFDTPLEPASAAPESGPRKGWRFVREAFDPESRATAVAGWIARRLVRRRALLSVIARYRSAALPFDFGFSLHAAIRLEVRKIAARDWHRSLVANGPPLDAALTLFRTGEHPGSATDDLGWRGRCSQLTVMRVPGTHVTMFDRANGTALREAFVSAMNPSARRSGEPLDARSAVSQ